MLYNLQIHGFYSKIERTFLLFPIRHALAEDLIGSAVHVCACIEYSGHTDRPPNQIPKPKRLIQENRLAVYLNNRRMPASTFSVPPQRLYAGGGSFRSFGNAKCTCGEAGLAALCAGPSAGLVSERPRDLLRDAGAGEYCGF
jgi:hypothetical protein